MDWHDILILVRTHLFITSEISLSPNLFIMTLMIFNINHGSSGLLKVILSIVIRLVTQTEILQWLFYPTIFYKFIVLEVIFDNIQQETLSLRS